MPPSASLNKEAEVEHCLSLLEDGTWDIWDAGEFWQMEINELMSDRSERSKNDPKQDVVGLCFRLYSVVHLNMEPYLLGILGPLQCLSH